MTALTIDDFANTGQLIYVATPYSLYAQGHALAHIHASKATAELQRRGIVALSPIAHSHPVALFGNIDKLDHEHWAYQNVPLMQAAAGCVVVKLPGWEQSEGVRMEIAFFTEKRKPIVYWDWPCDTEGAGKPDDAELRDMSVAEGQPLRNPLCVYVPVVAWEPC